MPICASPKNSPVLRRAISSWGEGLSTARNLLRKIESLSPGIKAWSEVGEPMLEANRQATNWKDVQKRAMEGIIGKLKTSDAEKVMAALVGKNPERFYELEQKHHAAARKLEDMLAGVLQETGGLSEPQARKFLREDMLRLRQANGDAARLDANNIYPETFQPFLDDILRGEVSATQNNAYAFAHDVINLGARNKFYRPVREAAQRTIRGWENAMKRAELPSSDVRFAAKYADDFLDSMVSNRQESSAVIAKGLDDIMAQFRKVGIPAPEITPQFIGEWAGKLASYHSGVAMSFRPAIAIRDSIQAMMMAPKIGFRTTFKALKEVYGKGLDDAWWARAADDLGMPEGINMPIFADQPDVFIKTPIGRAVKKVQEAGNLPRRWIDKQNRFAVYRGGERSILDNAPKLLSKQMTWEEFLWETGLKGSFKTDQDKIRSMLMGVEQPNIEGAAREYGKTLSKDVNFVYDSANAPLMFKGTMGKMFGQYGMWPVGWTEYMWQNMSTPDWGYRSKFLADFAKIAGASLALGHATGIDTSSWAMGNPLTFQGGPWFQTIRDVATLASTNNEFEVRKARAGVGRMINHMGTPFAGALNPIGGLTTDLIQARNAENPVEAMILALGFNLQSSTPATRR